MIHLLGFIDTDTVNYKKISMVLEFPYCTMKCGTEFCQNAALCDAKVIKVDTDTLIKQYISNPISHAIVMQGLEPFDSFSDVLEIITVLRETYGCMDDIVIYTGYYRDEIQDKLEQLKRFLNIIVKFGRYIPGQEPHYDALLDVNLASDNQYAERIS